MTLVSAMPLRGDAIPNWEIMHSGRTRVLVGRRVAAPLTLKPFLRSLTVGHVRQLDRLLAETLGRACARRRPDEGCLVVDLVSFVCAKPD